MSGPSSIPISEILAFCNLFNIQTEQEISIFVTLIQRMDMAYLDLMDKKRSKNDNTNSSNKD